LSDVFAYDIGHARRMMVGPSGVVYVNTWSGAYGNAALDAGGFLVALQDKQVWERPTSRLSRQQKRWPQKAACV